MFLELGKSAAYTASGWMFSASCGVVFAYVAVEQAVRDGADLERPERRLSDALDVYDSICECVNPPADIREDVTNRVFTWIRNCSSACKVRAKAIPGMPIC